MASWYYRDLDEEIGPVTPAEMKERVADGTIVATTSVRREDGNWTTAERVPGLIGGARGGGTAPLPDEGDATGGLIPYKNGPALVAYYLGIFSLAPCVLGLGAVLGVPAIVCGVIGLKKRKEHPAVRGSAHAWIGIVLGGITTTISLLLVVAAVVAALNNGKP